MPWISNDLDEGVAQDMGQYHVCGLGAEGLDADEEAPPSQEPSSATLVDTQTEMRIPEERYCSDWLRDFKGPKLDVCKRCGPTLCNFVAATFHFAKTFQSAESHDTALARVLRRGRLGEYRFRTHP